MISPILFINILYYFSVIILVSIGLTLIIGVLGVLNLAQGALYALGAYIAYSLISKMASYNIWLGYIGIILASIIVFIIGVAIEFGLIRPIYKYHVNYQLLLTFGLQYVIYDIIKFLWGFSILQATSPADVLGVIDLGGRTYPTYNIVIIIAAIAILISLWVLLKSDYGKIIRISAADREMAEALAVNVKTVFTLVFGLGVWMAGIAGALILPTTVATLGMGEEELIITFAILVIAGLGSLKGAVIAAIMIAITRTLGIVYFPEIELAVVYLIMTIILIFKPEGLFGKIERRI